MDKDTVADEEPKITATNDNLEDSSSEGINYSTETTESIANSTDLSYSQETESSGSEATFNEGLQDTHFDNTPRYSGPFAGYQQPQFYYPAFNIPRFVKPIPVWYSSAKYHPPIPGNMTSVYDPPCNLCESQSISYIHDFTRRPTTVVGMGPVPNNFSPQHYPVPYEIGPILSSVVEPYYSVYPYYYHHYRPMYTPACSVRNISHELNVPKQNMQQIPPFVLPTKSYPDPNVHIQTPLPYMPQTEQFVYPQCSAERPSRFFKQNQQRTYNQGQAAYNGQESDEAQASNGAGDFEHGTKTTVSSDSKNDLSKPKAEAEDANELGGQHPESAYASESASYLEPSTSASLISEQESASDLNSFFVPNYNSYCQPTKPYSILDSSLYTGGVYEEPDQHTYFHSPYFIDVPVPDIDIEDDENNDMLKKYIRPFPYDQWLGFFGRRNELRYTKCYEQIKKFAGNVDIERAQNDYRKFQQHDVVINDSSHILEMFDFPSTFTTADVREKFRYFCMRGFFIKWVDDTHCLLVFNSPDDAQAVLSRTFNDFKVRPLAYGTEASKNIFRKANLLMRPPVYMGPRNRM